MSDSPALAPQEAILHLRSFSKNSNTTFRSSIIMLCSVFTYIHIGYITTRITFHLHATGEIATPVFAANSVWVMICCIKVNNEIMFMLIHHIVLSCLSITCSSDSYPSPSVRNRTDVMG